MLDVKMAPSQNSELSRDKNKCTNQKKSHNKLSTFVSVDMEILNPWSTLVHPEAKLMGVQ